MPWWPLDLARDRHCSGSTAPSPSGKARDCKSRIVGSIPTGASQIYAISSEALDRCLDQKLMAESFSGALSRLSICGHFDARQSNRAVVSAHPNGGRCAKNGRPASIASGTSRIAVSVLPIQATTRSCGSFGRRRSGRADLEGCRASVGPPNLSRPASRGCRWGRPVRSGRPCQSTCCRCDRVAACTQDALRSAASLASGHERSLDGASGMSLCPEQVFMPE